MHRNYNSRDRDPNGGARSRLFGPYSSNSGGFGSDAGVNGGGGGGGVNASYSSGSEHLQLQQNDDQVDLLSQKMSMLREVSLQIGEEVTAQNRMLRDTVRIPYQ